MDCQLESIGGSQVLALIGQGGQANVYLVSCDSKLYAAKVFNFSANKSEPFAREAEILQILDHPNLVRLHRQIQGADILHKDGTKLKRATIFLEYAQKGDLFDYISVGKSFRPEICRALFKQVLNAIGYLEQKGISHRDIKPENILFDSNYQIKVTDFGLAALSRNNEHNFMFKTKVGTEGFKAPEVDQGSYDGSKVDVFALGVLLFSIYAGSPPFMTTRPTDKIYKHIASRNYDRFWSIHQKNRPDGFFTQNFRNLINGLLSASPSERPSIQQLWQDSWLNQPDAEHSEIIEELAGRFAKILSEQKLKKQIYEVVAKKKVPSIKEQNPESDVVEELKDLKVSTQKVACDPILAAQIG